MANYVFETMVLADAAAFAMSDSITFATASVASLSVVDTAPAGPLAHETITLSLGARSLTFDASNLSYASQHHQLILSGSNESLVLGTAGADDQGAGALQAGGVAGHGAMAFGFGGADSILGGAANDTLDGGDGNDTIVSASTARESDYLFGGGDADSITGGAGNDHIYGNLMSSVAGAADGADTIDAGGGNDYVNGNAGADSILGGVGNDRLYGGADLDSIDGGDGNDYIQGNKGADRLVGGAGDDTVHGGADGDALSGGDFGNDRLYGDAGNDHLWDSYAGYTWMAGGPGNDEFDIGFSPDNNLASPLDAPNHGLVTTIADFTDGEDQIALPLITKGVLHADPGIIFATPEAALTYADLLLAGTWHLNETWVAAISVGSDTYLFFSNLYQTFAVDAVLKVEGVHDTVFDMSDFV